MAIMKNPQMSKIIAIYNISNKVIKLISKAMKYWKFELTAGEKTLAEVKIQRRIFQGNAL